MRILITMAFLFIFSIHDKEIIQNKPGGGDKNTIIIFPKVYEKAFPNPLKGFRSGSLADEDYPLLSRIFIKWNEIENSENDGVEKIVDYCNRNWKDLPGKNRKVIPRVYIVWPFSSQNDDHTRDTVYIMDHQIKFTESFMPADMKSGDFSSEQFKVRLIRLIAKLGKAWDNDPRVAYVEMGLWGWWGEQQAPRAINSEMQKLMGDAFVNAFKNKLIMVRSAKDFTSFQFGSYWDSFAHSDQVDEGTLIIAQGGKWKTSVRGGEVAYNWGDRSKTGRNPDESLKNKANYDYIIDYIRKVHCNHLGWIDRYNAADPDIRVGADEVQKNLGYNFVLDEVGYTKNVLPGDAIKIRFIVRNTGSSPIYYNWPLEVSILNPFTKKPVWKAVFQDVDIRTWLPGDQWDSGLRRYTIEPEKNIITGQFKLPGDIKKGEYIIALSILDPAGNVPAVRFAVTNYFNGGRHPIGKIGVDKSLKDFKLKETDFDDMCTDRTLFYVFK
jgi:hypothetical protein